MPGALCSQIEWGSAAYEASVALRRKVLRAPLGLDFTTHELESEQADFHLACYENGELVACLVLVPQEDGVIKMRQVAVAESVQRLGIGRVLTAFAEEFARDRGFRTVTLH